MHVPHNHGSPRNHISVKIFIENTTRTFNLSTLGVHIHKTSQDKTIRTPCLDNLTMNFPPLINISQLTTRL
uniref:Uncharacterized protein n=1 Tax=Rhizophora mucronata TaxID=61149 RepID=A0A2P2P8M1_RHIMU